MAEPSERRWEQLYADGIRAGLVPDAAWAYATLSWWGLFYGVAAPKITSGRRTTARQRELYRQDPRRAAPPGSSLHERGRAWDIADNGHRHWYGSWASSLGVRWGQNFSAMREPWHFDIGG